VIAGKLLRHVRPLPAVITLTAALLVIKGEGLVEARAQDGKSAAPASSQNAKHDPAGDESEQGSASTVDVLTSLAHRRSELDAREQELTTRENLIVAAAKRVDQRIAELKALQMKLQSLLGQRDSAEQKQFDQLVKSYASMRPKDAARIFNALSDDVLVPVAAAMKADVLGAILAQMQPEAAQKLTVKLANRLNPQKIETQNAQMAAATLPPAGAQPASPPAAPSAAASTPTPTPSQSDQSQAAPAQTQLPKQAADNSPATLAPTQSAPAQAAPAQPAPARTAGRHRRAKKLAAIQAAYSKPAPVPSMPAPSASQRSLANVTPRPPQPAAPTPPPPALTAATSPAAQQTQPTPQHTAQTTTAPVTPTGTPVPAPAAPTSPSVK
jgi:flagellar motility protein MotE (MotC chaperone)